MSLFVRIAVCILLIFMVCNSQAKVCSIGREPDPAYDNKLRWVIPVPDPCRCTEIRIGGINARSPCRPFTVTYHDAPIISNDYEEIRNWLECPDFNECDEQTHTCISSRREECFNTPGSYDCVCQEGYQRSQSDVECKDFNECEEQTHTCNNSRQEVCVNTPGSYDCVCQEGYQRNQSDVECKACHFSTVPHPEPYSYMFILEPQISPFTLNFSVETGVTAMVGLSEDRTDRSVVIEILFGYNSGKKIVVRACMPHLCSTYSGDGSVYKEYYQDTPLTSGFEYRPFWIHYNEGVVTAGKGGQQKSLVEWNAGAHHGRVPTQLHIGISTWENGYGEWDFCAN